MQLSNYHSHCTFCDGRSTPEDFIKFAVAHGFRAYGFSSHSPLPFETFWNMSKDDMPEYLTEIERLKKKYSDRLEIYVGLEIDFLDESYNASIPYFRNLPLDYRIGSIHFLPIAQPLAEENMVNGHKCEGFDLQADWYQKPFNDCLHLIAEKGLMVEVNTKNLVKKQEVYPHTDYLHRLRELDIPVMVNSDCHYPDLVNDGRAEAFELLKKAGFKSTRELIGGQWQDVAI